jgi:2-oxoglutarate ferredoxin oxidoreductase subunit gamma
VDRFEQLIAPGGFLFVNTSLIHIDSFRQHINVIKVPANDIAESLGDMKVANMVMLGAYISIAQSVSLDLVEKSLPRVLDEKYHRLVPLNIEALRQGGILKKQSQSYGGE